MQKVKLTILLFIFIIWTMSVAQDVRVPLHAQFKKELMQIADNIVVAVGFGASNSVMIEGPDSLIIVDTMLGTEGAQDVLKAFRQVTAKPISSIILTHSHSDHISGTTVFAGDSHPRIFARRPAASTLPGYDKLSDIIVTRSRRQFGSDLSLEEKIAGIAPVYRPMGGRGEGKMKPTHYLELERTKMTIAGIPLEIVAAPGETDDHLYVWIPDQRILICGDNYYFSFPNLYAIRGTPYRDVTKWIESLNLMIELNATSLISGHARPVTGESNVKRILTDYRDALQHIWTATLEGINTGLTPTELAHSITLPEHLADHHDLKEYYGVIAWSVRSIYGGYLGWFDGNPTNLFPLDPVDEARRIIALSGSKKNFRQTIDQAVQDKEYQWVCQLTDYYLKVEPKNKAVKKIKAEALIQLADQQISSNARHYYLATAKEILSEIGEN